MTENANLATGLARRIVALAHALDALEAASSIREIANLLAPPVSTDLGNFRRSAA